MYRLVSLGADCASPEVCRQALERYPDLIDASLVADYCSDWQTPELQGKIEIACMKAIQVGDAREKPVSVLPGDCWGQPGFQDCFRDAWVAARNSCDPAYGGHSGGDVEGCIVRQADVNAFRNCVPKFCAGPSPVPPDLIGPGAGSDRSTASSALLWLSVGAIVLAVALSVKK